MRNPFRYFNSSPEVIRLTVMMYVRHPLSLRQVEDILFERDIDVRHETMLQVSQSEISGPGVNNGADITGVGLRAQVDW